MAHSQTLLRGDSAGEIDSAFASALKGAIKAALIALLLSIPMLSQMTVQEPTSLVLKNRFWLAGLAVYAVFVGRFSLEMLGWGRAGDREARSPVTVLVGLALLLAAIALPFIFVPQANAVLPWQLFEARWPLLLSALIVLLVWIFVHLTRAPALAEAVATGAGAVRQAVTSRGSATLAWLGTFFGLGLVIFAFAMPLMPFADRYYVDLATTVLIYVMLGWGLNIVVGLAGLLDLGYVAFYAVGAYSYALLATHFDLGFWVCLPLAGILAGFWGIILGFPVLRLRGDYLAIVTLAFGEIIRVVLLNWYEFTGGPDGISGIPRPTLFGLEFSRTGGVADYFGIEFSPLHRIMFLYYVILVLALLTNWVTMRLRRLPIGRAWEALREDEIACRSLGINTTTTKLSAFATGAMFGGLAGSFFATRQGFISPESFTFIESAIILAIVVLGGLGSQLGVVIAAVLMIGGFEVFRELEQYRMLIFGLLMVVVMVWRPRGLISSRTPSVALHKKKTISGDLVAEGHG